MQQLPYAEAISGDLATTLVGRKKFRVSHFRMTFFRNLKKIILPPKISDDIFLVSDSILSVFCLSLQSEILYITCMTSFSPFLGQFVLSLTSHRPNTTSQKYSMGRMHGLCPTSNLEDYPPIPRLVSAHGRG